MFFRILEVMFHSSAGVFLPGAKHLLDLLKLRVPRALQRGADVPTSWTTGRNSLSPTINGLTVRLKPDLGLQMILMLSLSTTDQPLSKGGRVRRPEPPRDLAFLAWSLRPYVHCSRRSLHRSGTGGTCVPLGCDRGEYLVQAFACTQPPG